MNQIFLKAISGLIKYYLILLPLYLIELFTVIWLESFFEGYIYINFFLKALFAVIASFWIKKSLFYEKSFFYLTFFIFCFLNPFLASASLLFILKLDFFGIALSKIISDFLISMITYIALKALPN